MTNPSPLLPSTVSAPSSPRQASVSLSKIPRRRPSTQLQHPLPVYPSSASSSPTKSALHHHHHSSSAVAHARRPSVSKAHFASPPASVFPDEHLDDGQQHESATSPIQERRRFSTTARTPSRTRGGRDERDREEREAIEFETTQLRRAPSLSIHIPSSSASPSPHHPPSSSIRHSRRPSHPTATASPHHPRASTSTSTSAAASPSTPSSHYGAAFAPHSRRTSLSGRTPRGTPSHHSHHHPHHSPHPSSTMPTPSHSQTLPAHLPPRPAMTERTWSGTTTQTYTSFDLQHPRTPKDERSEGEGGLYGGSGAGGGGGGGRGWLARWLERRISEREEEGGEGRDEEEEVGERSALLGANGTGSRRSSGGEGAPLGPVGNGESGWKYARAEIACYARHILPPVFVFVFIVLLLALFFYREAVGKVVRPGT